MPTQKEGAADRAAVSLYLSMNGGGRKPMG